MKLKSLFEDKNITSLKDSEKVGLYYILTYIFFNLPDWLEDARVKDFHSMVEKDLRTVLDYLFSAYKIAYEKWLRFHLSDPFFLASDTLYAAVIFDKEYKIRYVVSPDNRDEIIIDYKSPSMDIRGLHYDYTTAHAEGTLAEFKASVERWGHFMHGKVMPIVNRDPLLAHAMLAVAFYLSPEDGPTTARRVAEDDKLFIDANGANNYICYDSFHAPKLTPVALIKRSYDEYLRNDRWRGKDLAWKIASMNLLINAQHYSGKMGSFIVTGDKNDKENWLTSEMLDDLSNMTWLPKISDAAHGAEKYVALRRLYDNWQNFLPWNR